MTFQVAEGSPRPTYPFRFRVADLEAERRRIVEEARPAVAGAVTRLEGLVALCDFVDPWGNAFGLDQVLFGGEPPTLTGLNRDHQTDVERRIAAGGGAGR